MLKTILRIAVLGDIDCIVKGPQEACKGVKVLDRLDYYFFLNQIVHLHYQAKNSQVNVVYCLNMCTTYMYTIPTPQVHVIYCLNMCTSYMYTIPICVVYCLNMCTMFNIPTPHYSSGDLAETMG